VRRKKRFDEQEWIEEDGAEEVDELPEEEDCPTLRIRPGRSRRSRRLIRPEDWHRTPEYTPTERLLLLDPSSTVWIRTPFADKGLRIGTEGVALRCPFVGERLFSAS
jgi:hypothetical protein